jgi:5'-3' exonuclease
MGIQNFHKWLISKYPESQIDIQHIKNKCHHLYIDMNFLLHYCSYGININDEKTLFYRITNNITFLINTIIPTKSITLVTDGSPPLAKLITQRKRRKLMARKDG